MKRSISIVFSLLALSFAFASDYAIQIRLSNVSVSATKLCVSVYNSEKDYNRTAYKTYAVNADKEEITITDKPPEGEYVISVFQDKNSNEKLDTSILGIPKEPVGISNYGGKGIPGGFTKLRMKLSRDNVQIPIRLTTIKE